MAGGLVGILGVALVSQTQLGLAGSASIIASMGSSAVLLFAVPHGPLSQPWPVFGGHLVSAIVGVTCAKLIPAPMLAAAIAVALAIGAMHFLRCIHPPGGATALGAVLGGDAVHQLGYQFVTTPVMLNAITILLVAFLFNAPFAWRRYPVAWALVADPPALAPPAAKGTRGRCSPITAGCGGVGSRRAACSARRRATTSFSAPMTTSTTQIPTCPSSARALSARPPCRRRRRDLPRHRELLGARRLPARGPDHDQPPAQLPQPPPPGRRGGAAERERANS